MVKDTFLSMCKYTGNLSCILRLAWQPYFGAYVGAADIYVNYMLFPTALRILGFCNLTLVS